MTLPNLPDEQELAARSPVQPVMWTPGQKTRSKRKAAFLRALQEEGNITRACEVSGVSEATVWRWRGAYPSFSKAVDDFLTRVRQQRIEESMYRIATSTDPKQANAAVRAQEFLLRSLEPNKYSERLKVEQSVTVNQQVQVIYETRDRMRAEQAEALARLRARTIDAPSDAPSSVSEKLTLPPLGRE